VVRTGESKVGNVESDLDCRPKKRAVPAKKREFERKKPGPEKRGFPFKHTVKALHSGPTPKENSGEQKLSQLSGKLGRHATSAFQWGKKERGQIEKQKKEHSVSIAGLTTEEKGMTKKETA